MLGWLQCCLPCFVVCFKVLTVSFSFPCHLVVLVFPFFFSIILPSSFPNTPIYVCIPYLILGAGTLLISHTSCPLQCSLLSPLPLPLHLTDPLPPSLAGTPCRTVWRRSIRQSNPESLPSGHSGDRWVTTEDGSGARRRSLIRAYTSSCVHASARVTEFL